MATLGPFTVAAIAARAAGSYQTNVRALPAGTYQEIIFRLTFDAGLADTEFQTGDVIFGKVETNLGGAGWDWLLEAEWHGGHEPQPDPTRGTPGGYSVTANNVVVPAGSNIRATARVVPGTAGGTVTFGVTATATT